jgi:hypothetical protein
MHFSPSYSAAFHETQGEVSALATGMAGVFLGKLWETFGKLLGHFLSFPYHCLSICQKIRNPRKVLNCAGF